MTAPLTPTVASAFFAMGTCITREMAQHWARIAAERGATPQQLADAWHEWEAAEASSVQVIGGAA